jgi:hypothetical protein
MALTEQTFTEKIEVMIEGTIRATYATTVERDGTEIARSYAYEIFIPGASTQGKDPRIGAIAAVVWTQDVLDAWNAAHHTP